MCCVDGLRRNQESSSRPSCPRVGPDRRSPFGPAPTSPSSQYALRRGRSGGSDRASVWPASSRSTSRRNSSMRARMVAKSSAARGRFTSAPPIALVKIWSRLYGPLPPKPIVIGLIFGRKPARPHLARAHIAGIGTSPRPQQRSPIFLGISLMIDTFITMNAETWGWKSNL